MNVREFCFQNCPLDASRRGFYVTADDGGRRRCHLCGRVDGAPADLKSAFDAAAAFASHPAVRRGFAQALALPDWAAREAAARGRWGYIPACRCHLPDALKNSPLARPGLFVVADFDPAGAPNALLFISPDGRRRFGLRGLPQSLWGAYKPGPAAVLTPGLEEFILLEAMGFPALAARTFNPAPRQLKQLAGFRRLVVLAHDDPAGRRFAERVGAARPDAELLLRPDLRVFLTDPAGPALLVELLSEEDRNAA